MDGGGSGANNVWKCIAHYRNDTSEQLLKAFGTESAIVQTLESYSLRNAYHGHVSGGNGDGTNSGADKNLDTAIAFLQLRKPQVAYTAPEKKGPNKALKNANQAKTETLLDLIRNESNLGTMVASLDAADPNWRANHTVLGEYNVKRTAIKSRFKSNQSQKK